MAFKSSGLCLESTFVIESIKIFAENDLDREEFEF